MNVMEIVNVLTYASSTTNLPNILIHKDDSTLMNVQLFLITLSRSNILEEAVKECLVVLNKRNMGCSE